MILIAKDQKYCRVYSSLLTPKINDDDTINLDHHMIKPLPQRNGFFAVNGHKRDFDLISHFIPMNTAFTYASIINHYKPKLVQLLKEHARTQKTPLFESDFYFAEEDQAFVVTTKGIVRPLPDVYFRSFTDLAFAEFHKNEAASLDTKIQRLLDRYCLVNEYPKELFLGYHPHTQTIDKKWGQFHGH